VAGLRNLEKHGRFKVVPNKRKFHKILKPFEEKLLRPKAFIFLRFSRSSFVGDRRWDARQ
jgi:hypothetical protein